MPVTKSINMNDYEVVASKKDLEGYQSLIIIPYMMDDGSQPDALFLRKGEKQILVADLDEDEFTKDTAITKVGEDTEYAVRVDRWFELAMKNEEFRSLVNTHFDKNNFDIRRSLEAAKVWLKKQSLSTRKTHLWKFLWKNWLPIGMQRHLNGGWKR